MTEREQLKIEVTRKNRDEILFVFGAICLIALMEVVAIMHGHNGQLLRAVCILIALLVGITIPCPQLWSRIKKIKELV